MKKIFTIMAMLLMQQLHVSAQITYGAAAGMVFSNYNWKLVNAEGKTERFSPDKHRTGFTIGGFANIPIYRTIYFQPGLNFVQKGYKFTDALTNEKVSTSINYIEIPLNILYKTNNGNTGGNITSDFMFGFGPSIAMAVSGKIKFQDNDKKETTNLKIGNGYGDNIERLDMGANIMMGVQTRSGFLLMVNYNFALLNMLPKGGHDNTLKNHYWGIKLGYMLKRK